MATTTCIRCHGNAFLERFGREEAAWVCLQCGFRRDLRPADPWPFTAQRTSARESRQEGVLQ
jgi:hypothetical protein